MRALVMTVARDEALMLPRWVEYYGGQVGVENLVVFDDNSEDGSTDDLPCTVHRLPRLDTALTAFEGARMRLVSGVAAGLLAWYDAAVFTDVDEFLVPDPTRHDGLMGYLGARAHVPVMAPLALNVVQAPFEAPLDPARPILAQRSFAKFVPLMCKPSVKRVPARWTHGSHGIKVPFSVDPELFMLHMKFADRDLLRRNGDQRRRWVEREGRPQGSSWAEGGAELLDVLDTAVSGDLDVVSEFDAFAVKLPKLVVEAENGFRTRSAPGQVKAMRKRPLVRIPQRIGAPV